MTSVAQSADAGAPLTSIAPLTLTEWQQRVFRATVVWFFIGFGIEAGWFAALIWAAKRSGNGLFGLSPSVIPLAIIAVLCLPACFAVGVAISALHQSRAARLALEMLAMTPATDPVVPAVLVRSVRAKRHSQAHQLLYAAHTGGGHVQSVLVPVPQGFDLPRPGSGAWLVLNEQFRAFASFAIATSEQHAEAASDPALSKLTRVQRGLAVPANTYLMPALVGLVVAIVAGAIFVVALG